MKGFLKRLLAFAVVAVMALSLVTVGAVSVDETKSGCSLTEGELGLLKKLGIIADDSDFGRGFTRGDLAVATAKMMNLAGNTSYADSPFADLPVESEYFPYVCALVDAGVLSGDANGLFRPDDTVQFAEICKVLTIPLGYKNVGEMTSYVNAARLAEISDGVDKSADVTVGTAYEMIYNALHASMFEPYIFGETVEYRINPNQTALKQFHNLVKLEGVADGIYGTTLTSPNEDMGKDEISVDGKTYKYSDGKDLFGYSVVYYLNADDESLKPQIQYIYADSEENKTLTVDADDIISKKGTEFRYYNDSDKEIKVEVGPYAYIIYNGVANALCADEDFVPHAGEVTFIDHNSDRKYDVVKITSYEYAIVKNVDAANRIVYAKYPDGKIIGKEDGREVELEFKVDGLDAHLMSLTSGTVIATQKTNNLYGKVYDKITVIGESVSGKITALDADSVKIDGESYAMAGNCVTDENEKGALAVGQNITAYKHDGRLVAILHQATDGFELGYLVYAGVTPEPFNQKVIFQVLCSDNHFKTFESAENLTIDGVKVAPANVLSLLGTTNDPTREARDYDSSSDIQYDQLVKYKANSNGEIYYLDTPYYNEGKESENSLRLTHSFASRVYFASSRSFNSAINDTDYKYEFFIGGDTKCWNIPMFRRDTEELFSTSLTFTGNESNYYVEAYNVGDDFKADIVLRYIHASVDTKPVNDASEHLTYIVKDIYDVLDEDGVASRYLSLVGNKATSVKVGEDLENAHIEKGDVIKYDYILGVMHKLHNMFGGDSFIEKFKEPNSRVIESEKDAKGGTNIGRLRTSRLIYGTIMDIHDDMIFHTTTVPDDGVDMTSNENLANLTGYLKVGNVYIFDKNSRTGNVEIGTMDDIITYKIDPDNPDKVVIGMSAGTIHYIYILRGWE